MCDFFLVNLDNFFIVVCTSFHEDYGFHWIHSCDLNPDIYFNAFKVV